MKRALNAVGYQLCWLAAVVGAGRGWWWAGPAACALFVLFHIVSKQAHRGDLALALAAVGIGVLVDGGAVLAGFVRYASPVPGPLPLWMLALWPAFALTLDHSLAVLQKHLGIAALLGLVGGPLAYLAAARLHALNFGADARPALAYLAVAWCGALLALVLIARRGKAPTALPLAGGTRA